MLMPTKILVPTDFSEYSDKALRQALDIAKEYKAQVYVIHVVHDEPFEHTHVDFSVTAQTIMRRERKAVNSAKKILEKHLSKFPEAKEVEVIGEVMTGVPYDRILEYQKEKGIDLIVISSLGRTGLAKYFIGSVARNVLKGSECPVLLTK
jgi:universal stress protein A